MLTKRPAALHARLHARVQGPPHGGNAADYEAWRWRWRT
ncbi:baseplate J/gp47 family protein [Candidatus Vondammii sp. HM_W22]